MGWEGYITCRRWPSGCWRLCEWPVCVVPRVRPSDITWLLPRCSRTGVKATRLRQKSLRRLFELRIAHGPYICAPRAALREIGRPVTTNCFSLISLHQSCNNVNIPTILFADRSHGIFTHLHFRLLNSDLLNHADLCRVQQCQKLKKRCALAKLVQVLAIYYTGT